MRLVLVGAISVSRSYWHLALGTLVMSLNIQTLRPRRGIEVKACNCAILSCGRKGGCVCAGNSQTSKHLPIPKEGYKFAIFPSDRSAVILHPSRLLKDTQYPSLYTVEVYGP